MKTFSKIPILDWDLLKHDKARFISELREAAIFAGFLYLKNPPIDQAIIEEVCAWAPRLFELSQTKKNSLAMKNSEHFFGYSRLGGELTRGSIDQREQFDFALDFENDFKPGMPEFLRLWGNAQWPEEADLPGFKKTYSAYISQASDLSFEFMSLLAEALNLPPNAFEPFYAPSTKRIQNRSKIVRYPPVTEESKSNQGVGPHFDGQFLTLLLQASPNLPGLQAQNLEGHWIDVAPEPNTLVVNFGKALETVTGGAILATSHRVVSPPVGSPARYSVPVFQNISQLIRLSEIPIKVPPEIKSLCEQRGSIGKTESTNFSEYTNEITGLVSIIGRVKSHPDVAEKHYPDLWRKYFPQGTPALGEYSG